MADRRRTEQVESLIDRLGLDDSHVVWDQRQDRWDTGVRSWQAHDPDADWHLVLQDDAIVCRDLLPALEAGLALLPERSVASLYSSGKGAWIRRGNERTRWLQHRSLIWGVAMAAPVASIADMLAWCDVNVRPNYDNRIARYYDVAMRWPAYYTTPSLVNHGGVPSLIDHPDGRTAYRFIGEDVSALDWVRTGHERRNRHG